MPLPASVTACEIINDLVASPWLNTTEMMTCFSACNLEFFPLERDHDEGICCARQRIVLAQHDQNLWKNTKPELEVSKEE